MKKQNVLTKSMLSRLSSYCFSARDFNFYVKCYINCLGPLGLDVDPGDTETGLGDGI